MAEGYSISQDDVVCRFFLFSTCRDGSKCLFSHDSTRRIPDSVCRYYLQGTCIFGDKCRYDHIYLNNENASKYGVNIDILSSDSSKFSDIRDETINFTKDNTDKENLCQTFFSSLSFDSSQNKGSNVDKSIVSTRNWINAPEFVPKHMKSYADTLKTNIQSNNELETLHSKKICPLFAEGECPFPVCQFLHGNVCELCQKACLHPFDEESRKSHIEKCEKELEQEMEFSFAMQNSMNKICGICMDVVLEKQPVSERRFGILEKCNHVYCLGCIRKWRSSKQYENYQQSNNALGSMATRSCPECRIASGFIIPSGVFVDSVEEKQRLISEYKEALCKKPCKYFKQGEGFCPFGNSCFYLHAKPDGTKVELPLPIRRRRQNQDGALDYMEQILLLDFLEYREGNDPINLDFMFYSSDTDDDDDDVVSDDQR